MRLALLSLGLLAGGCVEGLDAGELGMGRRVGVFPGEIAAQLPPLTDRGGHVYVATGLADSTGLPQPGTALVGGARGGWSEGCPTGTGARGGALGWVGATDDRAWLWTGTAFLEIDAATGTCTERLDRDPVASTDVVIHAGAPVLSETVSGVRTLAVISTGADPSLRLVEVDLGRGAILSAAELDADRVIGSGGSREEALFLVAKAGAVRLVAARVPERGGLSSWRQ